MQNNDHSHKSRRNFIGALASGTAALGLASIGTPLTAGAKAVSENFYDDNNDLEEWFKEMKGKHKLVFDVTKPNEVFPFAWPRIFLVTNQATGTPEKETNVMVVLRHEAIPFAFTDNLWTKYKLGEQFDIKDHITKAAAVRNPFWKPAKGDFKIPGVGEVQIGINELQDSGVKFCVCNMALIVYSARTAAAMNMKAEEVYNDWKAGILPGIKIVPSGVWAVGRAQERGCGYCYAG